jgi:hypothetical protein
MNSDTVSDALLDAAASSTFEDHDNGFGELIRFRCSTNSFHERSGCSWSIAPPPRRSRPNHVRRIDEKHYPSLTDPALELARLANATTELERLFALNWGAFTFGRAGSSTSAGSARRPRSR